MQLPIQTSQSHVMDEQNNNHHLHLDVLSLNLLPLFCFISNRAFILILFRPPLATVVVLVEVVK
jgi:hypothetical protein